MLVTTLTDAAAVSGAELADLYRRRWQAELYLRALKQSLQLDVLRCIARGLMTQPKLLLLDEPSLGLAPKIVEEVFEKIREIGKRGVTVLIVEQNVVDGLSISNRGYVVENGAVEQGLGTSVQELLSNERLRAAYLGL